MKNLKLALIGRDVSASVSPQIHEFIAKETGNSLSYAKISLPMQAFEGEIGKILGGYDGLNVTIPYKLTVIPHLKRLCGDALAFGAVNTVDCRSLSGYNTDGQGFKLMLENGGVAIAGKSFLILGGGGAGRSCAKTLADGGARVYIYDRHPEKREDIARLSQNITAVNAPFGDCYGIVNATGVGMHASVGQSPVGCEAFKNCTVAVDLIYSPEKSEFLRLAEGMGKKILNGAAMLFYQAYFAQCVWFETDPDAGLAKELFEKFLKEGII